MMKTRKRRKAEASLRVKKSIAESHDQMESLCLHIMDVPDEVFIDILLRLPMKDILACKCICKGWRSLILSTYFAKLHSAQSETSLLLQSLDSFCSPRTCYLFDPSDVHMNLNVRMNVPLRNAKGALSKEAVKKNHCVRLRHADHGYKFVNACNGLVCLSSPSTNDPAVVSNPVTGEYINIPKGHISLEDNHVDCGFGFCPTTDKYKVIRLDFYLSSGRRAAEVHTLGTQTWRTVGFAPEYKGDLRSPTYLNGRLHWFYPKWIALTFILSFDFGEERFRIFPPPGIYRKEFPHEDVPNASMGVLRGKLCMCRTRIIHVTLWVMEEYGIGESWTRLVEFRKDFWGRDVFCQPIEYLRNGMMMMFCYPDIVFMHYNDESKKWLCHRVYDIGTKYKAVTFVPSFLSLKEAVRGNERRVRSITSGCGKIKIQGERQPFNVTEERIRLPIRDGQ